MTITEPMRTAYAWLVERGGSGVLDRYGRMLAAGERAARFDSSTWLRLVACGALRGSGGRLCVADPSAPSLDEIARL